MTYPRRKLPPLRACHEITGAILALDPYSAHRLKRIQFIQSDVDPRLREGDIFSLSLHKGEGRIQVVTVIS